MDEVRAFVAMAELGHSEVVGVDDGMSGLPLLEAGLMSRHVVLAWRNVLVLARLALFCRADPRVLLERSASMRDRRRAKG